VRSHGICDGQISTGEDILEHFGFLYHSFHRLLHAHHNLSLEAGTIGQIVADEPSGFNLALHQIKKRTTISDYVRFAVLMAVSVKSACFLGRDTT
jgi:hypothetical protein